MRPCRVGGLLVPKVLAAIATCVTRIKAEGLAGVVPYQTAESKSDLKTTDIAGAARSYTLLISCTATEQAESTKR